MGVRTLTLALSRESAPPVRSAGVSVVAMPPKKRLRRSVIEQLQRETVDLTETVCTTCYSVPLGAGQYCSFCGSDYSRWQKFFEKLTCPMCYGAAGTHQCVYCKGDVVRHMFEVFFHPVKCTLGVSVMQGLGMSIVKSATSMETVLLSCE